MQSLWMLMASFMFAGMGACIKIAADSGASLAHVVVFRGVPSVVLIFLWASYTRRSLRPLSWKLHIYRNAAGVSAMWMGFMAIASLPLSTAVSLNYTAPLFIAGWLLIAGGSQRDPVRLIAVLAGFLGVVAILRPGLSDDQLVPSAIGLMGGALSAVAMMQIRQLGRSGEPEWRTVFIFSCFVCLSGLASCLVLGWQPLDFTTYVALTCVGLFGLFGQLAMTRAFGLGSALLTAALQYSTIIFAVLLGWLMWGDIPDLIAWSGMVLIVASGLLSSWRTYSENRIMQQQGTGANAAALNASEPLSAVQPSSNVSESITENRNV